jgi:hypothetical protein
VLQSISYSCWLVCGIMSIFNYLEVWLGNVDIRGISCHVVVYLLQNMLEKHVWATKMM